MKVMVLAEKGECETLIDSLGGIRDDLTFIAGDDVPDVIRDPAEVDVILAKGDCSPGSEVNSSMLDWRTHPHTYLVPCWFPVDRESLETACLWPRLAIDRFDPQCDRASFSEWLSAVAEWQQDRMQFNNSGVLEDRSGLELATSLCLRRATGVLTVFDDDGTDGELSFRDGNLVSASFRHLRGVEVFYEFLCIPRGGYAWDSGRNPSDEESPHPLSQLIQDGLKMIHDANLLHNFVPGLDRCIRNTDSQSALDDSAAEHFTEQKEIYGLIEECVPVSRIIEASPLSRPSTMALLTKWFSLEDVSTVPGKSPQSPCSVLIVDDSRLICRVLQDIFSADPRIRVAGCARDGVEALQLIEEHKPDVVTLDLQMPKMDGLTTLKHIQIREPRPVVVISAFTKATSRLTYESFKYGAVDVITKPAKGAMSSSVEAQNRELCDRILQASRMQLAAIRYIRRGKAKDPGHLEIPWNTGDKVPEKAVVVACGAGGFPSLLKLVFAIPDENRLPLTLIGMDMSRNVVAALVANLRKEASISVEEIPGAGPLSPGVCYMVSNQDRCRLSVGEKEARLDLIDPQPQEGSFLDELLTSAADSFKSHLTAILLSGDSDDGIAGVRRVRQEGGQVFALSPDACLRPALSEKAISIGCAEEIKNIEDLMKLFDAGSTPPNQVDSTKGA